MRALTLAHTYVARLTALFAVLCALSVFLYAFFLLGAVSHTAARSSAERASLELSGKLGVLQSQYLVQNRALTQELAHELGFVSPIAKTEVYARATSLLTLHSE